MTKLRQPLTDGELFEMFDRWSKFAANEHDWAVVSALGELLNLREQALKAQIEQASRDASAQRAACDEDYEGYGMFIGAHC